MKMVMNKVNLVHIGGDEKVLRPHLALGEKELKGKLKTNATAKKDHLINTKTNSGKINNKVLIDAIAPLIAPGHKAELNHPQPPN